MQCAQHQACYQGLSQPLLSEDGYYQALIPAGQHWGESELVGEHRAGHE